MGILLRKKSSGAPCTATMLIQYTRLLKSQMNKLLTTLENKGYVEAIVSQLIAQIGEEKAQALTQGINETVAALENILESSE